MATNVKRIENEKNGALYVPVNQISKIDPISKK